MYRYIRLLMILTKRKFITIECRKSRQRILIEETNRHILNRSIARVISHYISVPLSTFNSLSLISNNRVTRIYFERKVSSSFSFFPVQLLEAVPRSLVFTLLRIFPRMHLDRVIFHTEEDCIFYKRQIDVS